MSVSFDVSSPKKDIRTAIIVVFNPICGPITHVLHEGAL